MGAPGQGPVFRRRGRAQTAPAPRTPAASFSCATCTSTSRPASWTAFASTAWRAGWPLRPWSCVWPAGARRGIPTVTPPHPRAKPGARPGPRSPLPTSKVMPRTPQSTQPCMPGVMPSRGQPPAARRSRAGPPVMTTTEGRPLTASPAMGAPPEVAELCGLASEGPPCRQDTGR